MLKSKIYDFSNSFTAKQQNYLCRLAFHVNGLFIDGLYSGIGSIFPVGHSTVSLFLGLIFALVCGQAHPKFNKKVSKYLLQYSVVGLGFGMNLQASLASGKEGMEFTIISVIGTMIIGMFIGVNF